MPKISYAGYIDMKYKPSETDLVCQFRIEPAKSVSIKVAA
jgi:ribulose 1,5-bisphosphate carboxylase large subunit-like protein